MKTVLTLKVVFLLIFLSLQVMEIHAGVLDVMKLSREERVRWFLKNELHYAAPNAVVVMDSLAVLSKEDGDDTLYWYVRLFQYMRRLNDLTLQELRSTSFPDACPIAEVNALYWQYAGNRMIASHNYNEGLQFLLIANNMFENVGYEKLVHGGDCINELALYYYYSGHYATAIKYWERAIRLQFVSANTKASMLDGLGLACMSESVKDYVKASKYFSMCYNFSKKYEPRFSPIALMHYGRNLYLQGDVEKSLPYLLSGYKQMSLAEASFNVRASLFVADSYLALNKLEEAKTYLRATEHFMGYRGEWEKRFNSNIRAMSLELPYFQAKFIYFQKIGNFKEAAYYQQTLLALKDSLDQRTIYDFLDTSENIINAEKYVSETQRIQEARDKEVAMRNLTIQILLVFGLGVGYIVMQRNAKLLKEKEVQDNLAVYADQQLETSLETLSQYMQAFQDKNQLLERVSGELDQYKVRNGNRPVEREQIHRHVDALLSSVILTENDWNNFKTLFEKVHPGFFKILQGKYKDLTPAEIRLAALIRLNVPTREMSFMLSVNKETVHTARYRLRKKLGDLESDGDLNTFIENI